MYKRSDICFTLNEGFTFFLSILDFSFMNFLLNVLVLVVSKQHLNSNISKLLRTDSFLPEVFFYFNSRPMLLLPLKLFKISLGQDWWRLSSPISWHIICWGRAVSLLKNLLFYSVLCQSIEPLGLFFKYVTKQEAKGVTFQLLKFVEIFFNYSTSNTFQRDVV